MKVKTIVNNFSHNTYKKGHRKMENAKITNLYNLDETIAKEYLSQFTYPWEALAAISEYIK